MIIENGTIEFKRKDVAGIDPETGYPDEVSHICWGEAVPCQYQPVKRTLLSTVNGEHFTSATYSVLIEMQPLPDSEQVRLTDGNGNVLGEFSLLSPPEFLEAVGQIRLSL